MVRRDPETVDQILLLNDSSVAVRTLTVGVTGAVGDEEAGEGKAGTGKTELR